MDYYAGIDIKPDVPISGVRLQRTRRGVSWQAFEAEETVFIEVLVRELAGSTPRHLMPSHEKIARAFIDIAINAPADLPPSSIAEVDRRCWRGPTVF